MKFPTSAAGIHLFLLLFLPFIINCSSSNLDPLTESLVQLSQKVEYEISVVCQFRLVMGSKKAVYSYICEGKQINGTFVVQELTKNQRHDEHRFHLTSSSFPLTGGNVTCVSKYGMQWNFNITILTNGIQAVTVQGKMVFHQYSIVWVILLYSMVASAILPFAQEYYHYMSSLSIVSFLLSILLSTTVAINIGVIVYKYTREAIALNETPPVLLIFILILCMLVGLVHLYNKNKVYLQKINKYYNMKVRSMLLVLSYAISLLGLILYTNMHKDVSTYVVFASGLVYYMIGFVIFKHMKTRDVFFSFRLVVFDSLSILLLVGCSKLYPILHYQIPNFYMLVAALLLVSMLLIYGGITFILINVIKYDSELHDKSQTTLSEQKLPTRHHFHTKEQQNIDENGGSKDTEMGSNWKKLTQQSIVSQAPHIQVDQQLKLSMRAQI